MTRPLAPVNTVSQTWATTPSEKHVPLQLSLTSPASPCSLHSHWPRPLSNELTFVRVLLVLRYRVIASDAVDGERLRLDRRLLRDDDGEQAVDVRRRHRRGVRISWQAEALDEARARARRLAAHLEHALPDVQ